MRVTVTLSDSEASELKAAAKLNCRSLSAEIAFRALHFDAKSIKVMQSDAERCKVMQIDAPEPDADSINLMQIDAENINLMQSSGTSVRERMSAADAMPNDGVPNSPSSNYSKRRAAQVKLVQEAWHETYPKAGELVGANAKKWLVATGDCSEDVLDVFESRKHKITSEGMGLVNYFNKAFADYKPKPKSGSPSYVNPDWAPGPTREEIERENEEAKATWKQGYIAHMAKLGVTVDDSWFTNDELHGSEKLNGKAQGAA